MGANTEKGGIAALLSFLQLLLLNRKGFFFSFLVLNRWKYRSLVLASSVCGDLFSLPTLSTEDSDLQEKVLTAALGLLAISVPYRWLSAHTSLFVKRPPVFMLTVMSLRDKNRELFVVHLFCIDLQ